MNVKHALIVTILLALPACASFPAGTKVAPAFPDDPFELSKRTEAPQPRAALNTGADGARAMTQRKPGQAG
jgi:hypothetical protein